MTEQVDPRMHRATASCRVCRGERRSRRIRSVRRVDASEEGGTRSKGREGAASCELCEETRRRRSSRRRSNLSTHDTLSDYDDDDDDSDEPIASAPTRTPGTKWRLSPLSFLPFLSTAFAAPPPLAPTNSPRIGSPPPPSSPSPPTPTLQQRDVAYITTAITPTVLPTEVKVVPETRLPYVLTRADSGRWEKVESAWSLYGRQAGVSVDRTLNNCLHTFVLTLGKDRRRSAGARGDCPSGRIVRIVVCGGIHPPKGMGTAVHADELLQSPAYRHCVGHSRRGHRGRDRNVSDWSSVGYGLGLGLHSRSQTCSWIEDNPAETCCRLVFNRRKAHRKARRRADRLRRKAMAAAGLDENNINGSAAEAAFKEKLSELERQHRNKQRTDAPHGGFARVKVKKWTRGMRRRKGNKTGDEPIIEVIREDDEGDGAGGGAGTPKSNGPGGRRSSGETLRTISDVLASGRGVDVDGEGEGDGNGSRTSSEGRRRDPTDTTSPEESSNMTHTTVDDVTPPEGTTNATSSAVNGNGDGSAPVPYFPPAYRPASVRSGRGGRGERGVGGSNGFVGGFGGTATGATTGVATGARRRSSDSNQGDTEEDPPPGLQPTEKTRAPGYYPAPATAESEAALAVVSRAEGKSRMVVHDYDYGREPEDEDRVRHIATDDKRVLERMRMGGSQPPGAGAGAEAETASLAPSPIPSQPPRLESPIDGTSRAGHAGHEQGPSAPHVDLDDDGFERHDLEALAALAPADDPAISTSTSGAIPGRTLHPDIPPPPQFQPLRSFRSRALQGVATEHTERTMSDRSASASASAMERTMSERRLSEERREDLETMAQLGELDLLPEAREARDAAHDSSEGRPHGRHSSSPPLASSSPTPDAPSAPPAGPSASSAPSAPFAPSAPSAPPEASAPMAPSAPPLEDDEDEVIDGHDVGLDGSARPHPTGPAHTSPPSTTVAAVELSADATVDNHGQGAGTSDHASDAVARAADVDVNESDPGAASRPFFLPKYEP